MTKQDFMDGVVMNLALKGLNNPLNSYWELAEDLWNARPNVKKESSIKTPIKFIPPTIEEVAQYIREQKYTSFNATTWYNFYDSKGWMIGKTKMKSWKAGVRTWGAKEKDKTNKKQHGLL